MCVVKSGQNDHFWLMKFIKMIFLVHFRPLPVIWGWLPVFKVTSGISCGHFRCLLRSLPVCHRYISTQFLIKVFFQWRRMGLAKIFFFRIFVLIFPRFFFKISQRFIHQSKERRILQVPTRFKLWKQIF